MKIVKAKQVRFQLVVARSGAPRSFIPWGDPRRDTDFQKAFKQQRVMTVHRANVGNKKEFGTVGFNEGSGSTFLIFPKTLKPFLGSRIVGLDFTKIQEPVPSDAVKVSKRVAKISQSTVVDRHAEQKIIEKKKPNLLKTFQVVCTFTAEVNVTREIQANSLADAKTQLKLEHYFPDFSKAKARVRVKWTQKGKTLT
jgi:hypothetical protein